MATIITVHGTNATGPEEGPNWWQRTSEFERDVREFVQADDGKVDFKPLIWDGANSEMSRRKAGTKLLGEMKALEAQGNKYCLVGHSHGGSVIYHSLVENVVRGGELNQFSRWITVATPFIKTRPNKLLFSRLGLIGKSVYLAAIVTFFVNVVRAIFYFSDERFFSEYFSKVYAEFGLVNLVALLFPDVLGLFVELSQQLLPLLVLYVITWFLLRRTRQRHAPSTLRKAAECFGKSHLSLRHKNDEAVEGLRAVGSFRFSIFDRRLAVDFLLLITAAALPLVLTTVSGLSIIINPYVIHDKLREIGVFLTEPYATPLISIVPLYLLLFFVLLITAPIAILLSAALSRWLDRFTSHQIRRSALGDDVSAETAIGSLEMPSWAIQNFSALPEDISWLLTHKANEATAQSIEKFRNAISKLAFSLSPEKDPKKMVSEYITWNELIHNVYFKIPAFRKLVCYAIAHSPGFLPSEKLKIDPEYKKLGGWLEEIQMPRQALVHLDG